MIELNPLQARIYEWLREGYTINQITKKLKRRHPQAAMQHFHKMERLGAVKKVGKMEYQPLIDKYSIGWRNTSNDSKKRAISHMKLLESKKALGSNNKPAYKVEITDKQRKIIEENYGEVTRSKLVEMTGLERFDLNMAIIQMGLSQ